MAFYIVLLGPPGAGKGTQAEIIAGKYQIAHISSGDLFRENISKQTELGMKAKGFMDRGELVPDDVTIDMVKDRLKKPDCKKGALLDGFPRTPAQAEALGKMLKEMNGRIAIVPFIAVPEKVLVDRLGGRFTCRAGGHVYHMLFNPPKQAGICDVDGSELYQREDDKPETVENRIQVYTRQTSPLIEHYRKAGVLVEVDGSQPIEKVTSQLFNAIEKVRTNELG
jgi:adenylate kinase